MTLLILVTALAQAPRPNALCVPERGTDRLRFRDLHTPPIELGSSLAVWSGEEIIFADSSGDRYHWSAYSPANDRWRWLFFSGWSGRVPGDETRRGATVVWVAGRAVLWGGTPVTSSPYGGLALDPATDVAAPVTNLGAPTARTGHWAVAVDSRMFVWGGLAGQERLCDGAAYDPVQDRWAPMASAPAPLCASTPLVVLAAQGRVVVLGAAPTGSIAAAAYHPLADGWALIDPRGAPRAIDGAAVGPDGVPYVSEPPPASLAPADPTDRKQHAIYALDLHASRWTRRGHGCAGPMVALGDDWLELGGNCLLDRELDRCTELAMLADRPHVPVVTIGDGVLLRSGLSDSWGFPPRQMGPTSFSLLRRRGPERLRPGVMETARTEHTATLLRTNEVLVTGGGNGWAALPNAELYDPASATWLEIDSMSVGRHGHTATLLTSGKVLVVGGTTEVPPRGTALATAEIFDPTTRTWTATGALHTARAGHSATVLPSGEVLVVGGVNEAGAVPSAELYDTGSGRWRPAVSPPSPWSGHTATLLPSGRVLICGPTCFRYDPATRSWRATGYLDPGLQHTATLLADGRVLVVGGRDTFGAAALYDPATDRWTMTASLATARFAHTATRLPSGEVLVTGGFNNTAGGYLSSVEVFDPKMETWRAGVPLHVRRAGHAATLLATGRVLVSGGQDTYESVLTNAEEYAPETGRWIPLDSAVGPRGGSAAPPVRLEHRHGNVRGIVGLMSLPWGGRPSPTTFSAAARTRLLFRRGDQNTPTRPVAEVITDEFGLFEVDLPPGTYCIVGEEKLRAPAPGPGAGAGGDRGCLRAVWSACEGAVRVPPSPPSVVVVHLTLRRGGRPPCYHGPPPP